MKLNHLQRVACLAITGAMSTTPQMALEALLMLPKLEKYIEAEAKNSAFRLRGRISEQQLRIKGHTEALNNLYRYRGVLGADYDHINAVYMF